MKWQRKEFGKNCQMFATDHTSVESKKASSKCFSYEKKIVENCKSCLQFNIGEGFAPS